MAQKRIKINKNNCGAMLFAMHIYIYIYISDTPMFKI